MYNQPLVPMQNQMQMPQMQQLNAWVTQLQFPIVQYPMGQPPFIPQVQCRNHSVMNNIAVIVSDLIEIIQSNAALNSPRILAFNTLRQQDFRNQEFINLVQYAVTSIEAESWSSGLPPENCAASILPRVFQSFVADLWQRSGMSSAFALPPDVLANLNTSLTDHQAFVNKNNIYRNQGNLVATQYPQYAQPYMAQPVAAMPMANNMVPVINTMGKGGLTGRYGVLGNNAVQSTPAPVAVQPTGTTITGSGRFSTGVVTPYQATQAQNTVSAANVAGPSNNGSLTSRYSQVKVGAPANPTGTGQSLLQQVQTLVQHSANLPSPQEVRNLMAEAKKVNPVNLTKLNPNEQLTDWDDVPRPKTAEEVKAMSAPGARSVAKDAQAGLIQGHMPPPELHGTQFGEEANRSFIAVTMDNEPVPHPFGENGCGEFMEYLETVNEVVKAGYRESWVASKDQPFWFIYEPELWKCTGVKFAGKHGQQFEERKIIVDEKEHFIPTHRAGDIPRFVPAFDQAQYRGLKDLALNLAMKDDERRELEKYEEEKGHSLEAFPTEYPSIIMGDSLINAVSLCLDRRAELAEGHPGYYRLMNFQSHVFNDIPTAENHFKVINQLSDANSFDEVRMLLIEQRDEMDLKLWVYLEELTTRMINEILSAGLNLLLHIDSILSDLTELNHYLDEQNLLETFKSISKRHLKRRFIDSSHPDYALQVRNYIDIDTDKDEAEVDLSEEGLAKLPFTLVGERLSITLLESDQAVFEGHVVDERPVAITAKWAPKLTRIVEWIYGLNKRTPARYILVTKDRRVYQLGRSDVNRDLYTIRRLSIDV